MDLLNLFKNYLFSQDDKPTKVTVKNYLSDVNHFVRWYENTFAKSFNPQEVSGLTLNDYRTSCSTTFSPSSLERHFSSLRKFFKFLLIEGKISLNPFVVKNLKLEAQHDPWHIKDFKDFLYVGNASHLTIKNYLIDIKQFLAWAQAVTESNDVLGNTDSKLVEEYKQRLLDQGDFSPATVNRKLSSLRKYLSWAQAKGLVENLGLNVQNAELLRSEQPVNDATIQQSAENELKIKNSKLEIPNTKYSGFPPFRIGQKISNAFILALDAGLIIHLVKLVDRIEYALWKSKGQPVFAKLKTQNAKFKNLTSSFQILNPTSRIQNPASVKNLPKSFYAPLEISTKGFPWYKKAWITARYSRPKWYKIYHSYPIVHYLNFAILIIFLGVISFSFYNVFFQKGNQSPTLAASPVAPLRILSFQGRLTDASDNPISTSSALRFGIYTSSSATDSASTTIFPWQEVDTVSPDQDGIFNVILGNNSAIPSTLFTQNNALWLGVTVGTTSELTPRQQLATVAFASNAEALQGMFPTTSNPTAYTNTVLALDGTSSSPTLTIGGAVGATFQATGGQFVLSGSGLLLTTKASSNTNVAIAPDGLGEIDLQKPVFNSTNNNNLAGATGAVEVDDTFGVLATSSATAFVLNQTGAGDLFTASAGGTTKFTITYGGGISLGGTVSDSSHCIIGGTTAAWGSCGSSGGTNYWNLVSGNGVSNGGYITPINSTADFLLGAQSTSSAIFAFTGLSSTAHQTQASFSGQFVLMPNNGYGGNASIAGNLTLGIYGTGAIQTTSNQLLTIGGNTTGDIKFMPGNSSSSLYLSSNGNVGINNSNPQAKLDIGGASSTITNTSGNITITPTGNLVLTSSAASGVLIGSSTNAPAPLSISGGIGSNGALIVNQANSGDIIDASVSGTTKFIVSNTGALTSAAYTNVGGILYTSSTGLIGETAAGASSSLCLVGGTTPSWASCSGVSNNYWNLVNGYGTTGGGYITPINSTADFLIGGQATSSAAFAVLGLASSTHQTTASVSGQFIVMPNNGYGGTVGINTTSPLVALDVRGTSGTLAVASFSAKTAFASLIANNDGVGDLFTASASGWTRFTVSNTGALTNTGYTTLGGILYSSSATAGTLTQLSLGTSSQCLIGGTSAPAWSSCSSAANNYWNLVNGYGTTGGGYITPINSTADFLIGGQATSSAAFAVLGLASSTHQTTASVSGQFVVMPNNGYGGNASISGNLTIGAFSASAIQSVNNQLLTLGGNTTGNITLSPNNGSSGVINLNAPTINTNATTLALVNTTATTINFAGAATSLNMGAPTGSASLSATLVLGGASSSTIESGNGTLSFGYKSGANTWGTAMTIRDNTGNIGIGTTSPLTTLDVRGNSGTTAVASVSGNTSFAALVTNNNGVGDLFTASASGWTKFTVSNTGTLTNTGYTTLGGILYSSSATAGTLTQLSLGTSSQCLIGGTSAPAWSSCSSAASNYWQRVVGNLSPLNTNDTISATSSAATVATFTTNNPTGTLTNNTLIQNTGAGIVTNLLNLTQSGGTVTNGINFSTGTFGTGINLTGGTFSTNLISSSTLTVSSAGVASGLTGLTSSGAITFSGFSGANNGGVIYANSAGNLSQTAAGASSSLCLVGGTTPSWLSCSSAANNYWNLVNGYGTTGGGYITPINSTADFLIGGQATSSAAFAVLGLASSTHQTTASVSGQFVVMPNNGYGGTVGIGTTDTTKGKLELVQTTDSNAGGIAILNSTLGGSDRLWIDASNNLRLDAGVNATSNILLNGAGTGNVGIGLGSGIAPGHSLDVAGTDSTIAVRYPGDTYERVSLVGNQSTSAIFFGEGSSAVNTELQSTGAGFVELVNPLNNSNVNFDITSPSTSYTAFLGINIAGEGNDRARLEGDNTLTGLQLGPGSSARDLSIYRTGTSQLAITNNGASTGIKVGIGTTAPVDTLDVRGSSGTTAIASFSGTTSFAGLVVDNSGSGDLITASSSANPGGANPSRTEFKVSNSGDVYGRTWQDLDNSAYYMDLNTTGYSILTAGSVGIKTTTPTAALDVAGSASTSGNLSFNGSSTNYINLLNNSNLTFATSPKGDGASEANATARMTILNNGNVGIGTTSPGDLFVVSGTADITTLQGNTTTTNAKDTLYLGAANTNFYLDRPLAGTINIGYNTAKSTGENIPFQVYDNSTNHNVMIQAVSAGTGSGYNRVALWVDATNSSVTWLCKNTSGGNAARVLDECRSTAGGGDVAENITAANVQSGDILSLDPNNSDSTTNSIYKRDAYGVASSKEYDPQALGPITTWGMPISEDNSGNPNRRLFTVSGLMPIKVSLVNGPIHKGDPITTSKIPGVGMLATKAGQIVAKSIENWDGSTATQAARLVNGAWQETSSACRANEQNCYNEQQILALLDLSWYDPQVYLASTGNVNLVDQNAANSNYTIPHYFTLNDALGNPLQRVGEFSDAAIANLKVGGVSAGQITTNALSVVSENVTIAGQSLHDYIAGIVSQQLSNIQNLTSDNIISPIASVDELHTNFISPVDTTAQIGLKLDNNKLSILNTNNSSGSAVAVIDNLGNASFSGQLTSNSLNTNDATVSGTLHVGKIIADEIVGASTSATYVTNVTNIYNSSPSADNSNFGLISGQTIIGTPSATGNQQPGSGYMDISSLSGQLTYVDNLSAGNAVFGENLTVFGQTSLSDTSVVGQLSVNGSLILANNSVNVLGSDLNLQPLRQGGLSIMGGLVYIDTDGNLKVGGNADFAKNVTVHGALAANVISPLPGNDLSLNTGNSNLQVTNASSSSVLSVNNLGDLVASGAGTFSKLNLNLIQPALAVSPTEVVATGSAGTANISAYQTQVTIDNPNVTGKSLIYITPTSSTNNQVLYLLKQVPGTSFTVGLQNPSGYSIPFNWIIVN